MAADRTRVRELPQRAGKVREAMLPDWLVEIVRPRRVPVPWPLMVRAALAICVPLGVALAIGKLEFGLLPAIGGLLASVVDQGGPYLTRVKRVGSATVFGGAVGLVIGSAIHGRGWIAVAGLMVVAAVSALLSAAGSVGSVTGLQMLVYASLGIGPLGALRPWWSVPLEFLVGAAWAVLLIIPGWLVLPRAAEQRSVAAAYRALAAQLRAVGSPGFTAARQRATTALNDAYDKLLTARSRLPGVDRRLARLVAMLNATHPLAEAIVTLAAEGNRPPPGVVAALDGLADAIANGTAPPAAPDHWRDSPGARALSQALAGAARLMAGEKVADQRLGPGPSLRDRAGQVIAELHGGSFLATFTTRLVLCIGVAAVLSEILPLQRSYWVVLTVAIVLKPDFGSVFARGVQRGLGTIVGAVVGAIILALVPYGPWLLLPVAVLAALLPLGRAMNYGLLATFLTPLVVVLIDLLDRSGWRLAEARLTDTLLGCGVALGIGYAPWPSSWHAHLPARLADALSAVAAYIRAAPTDAPGERSRLRRATYRQLSDLRAEFQRTMSEPRRVSRQAAAWWPAVVGMENVVDAATAAAVGVQHGAPPLRAETAGRLAGALEEMAAAIRSGKRAPRPDLPSGPGREQLTDAIRAVQQVIG